jgi:hypothetical protein
MSEAALRSIAAALARLELEQAEQASTLARLTAAVELLRESVDERNRAPDEPVDRPELLAALRGAFADGTFTAGAVLIAVDDDPHGRLADAVAAVVDFRLTPQGRVVRLAYVLKGMRGLRQAGMLRGAGMYCVASLDSQDSQARRRGETEGCKNFPTLQQASRSACES